jgi:hypothetical protein
MADFDLMVNGLDKLTKSFDRYPAEIGAQMKLAGIDASKLILQTKGLRLYPEKTERNQPGRVKAVTFASGKTAEFRTSYYQRSYGTMTPVRGGGYKLIGASERFGTKWYTKQKGMDTVVGNNASYAAFLSGNNQVAWAAQVGWRKLREVADQKMTQIRAIYAQHISLVTRKLGL